MKCFFEKLILSCAAVFLLNVVLAQENQSRFLQEAIKAVRAGDCQRASDNYEMAKKLDNVTDVTMEKAIALCFENEAKGSTNDSPMVPKDSVFTCDYLDYYFYMDNLPMTYDRAVLAAKESKYANHSDWHVPTITELQLVIDYHCGINSDFPSRIKEKKYWSSTPTSSTSSYIYYYKFDYKDKMDSNNLGNKACCVFVRYNKDKSSSNSSSKGKKKK